MKECNYVKKTKTNLSGVIFTFFLISTLLTNVVYASDLTTVNNNVVENTIEINPENNEDLIISNELELNLKNKKSDLKDTITIPFTQDSNYNQIIESFDYSDYTVESFNVKDVETYVEPRIVGTLFDIGCLSISIAEFNSNPSLWRGIGVVFDDGALVLPGVPAVNGALVTIKKSSKLQDALTLGIELQKKLE